MRIRAAYHDDKNGSYKWYIDQMYPYDQEATYGAVEIERMLGDSYAMEDGQIHYFDVINRSYHPFSDHHDFDHYDYYVSHSSSFSSGSDRPLEPRAWHDRVDSEEELDKRLQAARDEEFNALVEKFSKLDFVNLVRSVNAEIEYLDKFYRQFDWSNIVEEVNLDGGRFFSVWFMFDVEDGTKFHKLVSFFPQEVQYSFRLTRACIYLPNDDGNGSRRDDDEEEHLYEITFSVHPHLIGNKSTGRNMINEYLRKIGRAVDKFCSEDNQS